EVNLRTPVAGKRVLLLGAGGAARGALLPFLGARPVELVIANRHVEKARALAAQLAAHGRISACAYGELERRGRFDLVINATSASLT
ncbi:shikimate dehydrogenase, partial [Burkholderia sp. SIMBA_019]